MCWKNCRSDRASAFTVTLLGFPQTNRIWKNRMGELSQPMTLKIECYFLCSEGPLEQTKAKAAVLVVFNIFRLQLKRTRKFGHFIFPSFML